MIDAIVRQSPQNIKALSEAINCYDLIKINWKLIRKCEIESMLVIEPISSIYPIYLISFVG